MTYFCILCLCYYVGMMQLPSLLSSFHSLDITYLYIYFISYKMFLLVCLIFLNTSVLIANRESCSMLEGSEVSC